MAAATAPPSGWAHRYSRSTSLPTSNQREGDVRGPWSLAAASASRRALVLSALGYDVLATDTRHVCDTVLRRNVAANLPHLPATAGSIQVRELDWNVESDGWRWDDPMCITPAGNISDTCGTKRLPAPPFDLILSSDTLYDVALVSPFFRTVQALAAASRGIGRPPLLLLALERRDPAFIDAALASAPVALTQVPTKKVRKAMERGGMKWDRTEWEGIEIWSSRSSRLWLC